MNVKQKKKDNIKSQYGMAGNTWFMVRRAWKIEKSVLFFCLANAVLGIFMNLLGLYIGPMVLKPIETGAALHVLVETILFFAGSMLLVGMAMEYVKRNELFGKIELRVSLLHELTMKKCTISYPTLWNQEYQELHQKALEAACSNSAAAEAIWQTMQELLKSIAGFAIYLLVVSTLNVYVMLVIAVASCISYFAGKKIYNWGYEHRKESGAYLRQMEHLNGVKRGREFAKDIRIFGMNEWLEELYTKSSRLYMDYKERKQKHYIWANVIDIVLAFARNGIAYAYLIAITLNNHLSAAEFLLYFGAVSGFSAWMNQILSGFSTLNLQCIELSATREFLEEKGDFPLEEGKPLSIDYEKAYQLELRHVSYRYPGTTEDILHDVNLMVRPGEKIAVVGKNGAGKTTLVKLICGFCNPTEGEILLNGVNINTYRRKDYYRLFSAVFQEFSVLAATVGENVSGMLDEFDEERFWDCVEKAGMTEKIKSLPKGYDTRMVKWVYGDAAEFSGGELQRLMLARALYKNGAVIVLDEPTAALDPIAENDIYMKYGELTDGRTSFFISHRLASTRFCDRILFIADGNIAEEGTHEELLQKGGYYAELFEIQSRYYREGEEEHE